LVHNCFSTIERFIRIIKELHARTYRSEVGEEEGNGGAYTPVVTENDWKVFLRRVNVVYTNGHVGRDTRLAAAFYEGDWRLLLKLFHRLGPQNERRGC